jgi:diguanylate cyclase (GGDEF)-like protein
MDIDAALHQDSKSWNRSVLNAYWLILGLILLSEVWGLFNALSGHSQLLDQYIRDKLILTNAFILGMITLVEILYRLMTRKFEYLLILLGIYISCILFFFDNQLVEGIQITFILPILMSIYYFNSRKIVFAGILTLLLCMLLFPLKMKGSEVTIVQEMIATSVMVAATSILGFAIRSRGLELIMELQEAIKSEQKLIIQQIVMDKISKEDALTGLNNHKTFHIYLDNLIEQAESNRLRLQLAVLDMDDFKSVNDTYGHWVGDIVLKEAARLIESHITSEDIAFRYGGEEFSIIFTNKSIKESLAILERMQETLSEVEIEQLPGRRMTFSAGLGEYRAGEGKESFFNKADAYLYKAKDNGKHRIICEG